MFTKFSALAAALAVAPAANAMWILSHQSLTQDRLDPIVQPNVVSTHVHNIVGSNTFSPDMSYAKQRAGTCTTSPVQDDMSNYWVPQLYHSDNGKYEAIPITFVQTYYLQRGGPKTDIKTLKAFPEGLRMIAGNQYRTTYDASNTEDLAISFVCLDYKSSSPSGPTSRFPTRNCPDGMRAQVTFPSCWDGKNLDSADHKSHMAYPVGGAPDNGDCPATHPVKLITLFNEWVFDVGKFSYASGKENWVFANGGNDLSFHADFINGWKTETLQAAVEQCTTNLFGDLESCPPFKASLDREKANKCFQDSMVEEDIKGPLTSLPGCNPVTGGGVAGPAKCDSLVAPAIKGFSPAKPAASAPAAAAPHSSAPAASSAAHPATHASSASASAAASSAPAAPSSAATYAHASSLPHAAPSHSSGLNVLPVHTAVPVAGAASSSAPAEAAPSSHASAAAPASHASAKPAATSAASHASAQPVATHAASTAKPASTKTCKNKGHKRDAAFAHHKRAIHNRLSFDH